MNTFFLQDSLYSGRTESKLVSDLVGTFALAISLDDSGGERWIPLRFSANLFGNQTGNPLLSKAGPPAGKSPRIDIKSDTNFIDLNDPSFDQLDRTKAMERWIVQGIAIERSLIDKDRPIAIEIAKPGPPVDVNSILGQSQVLCKTGLCQRHPCPS